MMKAGFRKLISFVIATELNLAIAQLLQVKNLKALAAACLLCKDGFPAVMLVILNIKMLVCVCVCVCVCQKMTRFLAKLEPWTAVSVLFDLISKVEVML